MPPSVRYFWTDFAIGTLVALGGVVGPFPDGTTPWAVKFTCGPFAASVVVGL